MGENSTIPTKRKHPFLPLLTVLFLVSYAIMTLLIVEQGNTIEAQRLLIKQLFNDSAQLSALKGHEAQKHHAQPGPKSFARRQAPQAQRPQREPRVDAPQAPADLQRSAVSL